MQIVVTEREYKTAILLYERGLSDRAIADVLKVSRSSVQSYINQLKKKSNTGSTREFMVWMHTNKLILKNARNTSFANGIQSSNCSL